MCVFQMFQTPESFTSQLQLVDAGQTELPQPPPVNTQPPGEALLCVPPTQVSLLNLPNTKFFFWFHNLIQICRSTDFLVLGQCSVSHQFSPEVKVGAIILYHSRTCWTLFEFFLLFAQKLKKRTKRHPL